MSEHHPASRQDYPARPRLLSNDMANPVFGHSFGDPKARPHTPRQTLTSATFPSPLFETPKHYQGSFSEPGGLTPRFAEEYSVFNSTPGNLRGSQGPFADFTPATPSSFSRGHKRLLSVEGPALDIAAHVSRFSSISDRTLPPSNPHRRRPSSPGPWAGQTRAPVASDTQPSPHFAKNQSVKKVCRDPNTAPPEPSQVISPPPTTRKAARQFGPRLNMHQDQAFGQPDLIGSTQHDMAVLMGSSADMFGYPMSAPAAAPANFWDPSVSMSMDLEFNDAGHDATQPPATPSHRHTGSFDWNAEIQLFQDVAVPAPCTNQDSVQQARRERALAPKPPASEVVTTSAGDSAARLNMLDDPFGIINPGDGVDPGLLFGRPHSALGSDFGTLSQSGPAKVATSLPGNGTTGDVRRANSTKAARSVRGPDRALAGSPIKSSMRPALGRSWSENRGKRAVGRKALPPLAEAGRTAPPTNSGPGVLSGRSGGRPSGRLSPSKTAPHLSSLASIPEASPQRWPRTSVRLTIDASGRARAETTVTGGGSPSDGGLYRSRSSREAASRAWDSSDDDSSTDDEPIIIPSRCSSFNTSFALPDPRKPVGSMFHGSYRDVSDRSRSTSANGAESEAETVVNDRPQKGGDATSELRKVVEDRQKWSSRMGSARSGRFSSTHAGNFPGGIISPTSLTGSSHGSSGQGIRCVCNEASADEADGFMLQWYVSPGVQPWRG